MSIQKKIIIKIITKWLYNIACWIYIGPYICVDDKQALVHDDFDSTNNRMDSNMWRLCANIIHDMQLIGFINSVLVPTFAL